MSAKTYVVTVRSTHEPMGIVSASHDYELFAGIASLADEAGLDISQVEVRDLATPSWPDAVIPSLYSRVLATRVGP